MKLLILLTIILALTGAVILSARWVKTILINAEVVRTGEMDDSVQVNCLVLNREYVYSAPERGRFENLLVEGERVRRGTLIGYYYPDGEESALKVRAQQSGVVCYHPDNLEKKLLQVNSDNFNTSLLQYQPHVINDGSFHFEKGQPVLKMLDNLASTNLIGEYPASHSIKAGDVISIKYQGQFIGEAKCLNAKGIKAGKLIFLAMDGFCIDLMDKRKPRLGLVSQSYQGVIVPKDSLVRQNGVWGVYRVVDQTVEFESVTILYKRNDQVVVQGLSDGDYVVTTPGMVHVGDKL